MGSYKTKITITDFGPYITELILYADVQVSQNDISAEDFVVYTERKDKKTGKIVQAKNYFWVDTPGQPAKGFRDVVRVYPCDSEGNPCHRGNWIALEMGTDALGKIIEGMSYTENDYKVTYVKSSGILKSGYTFTQNSGCVCPQLKGWKNHQSQTGRFQLRYGFYTPSSEISCPLPLIVWLHGAGEGGTETEIAYTGNKAVEFSSEKIQQYFGGQAWVLVPQCPTVWMDDGKEQLGQSNISIYTSSLKDCIDEFVNEHSGMVDMSRIYLGGCSNGGFMTLRMAVDYPGFFAAVFPVCEAFYQENITETVVNRLKNTPCWFVHCKGDTLVDPEKTSVPLYLKLCSSGASNVHFTYVESMDSQVSAFWKNVQLPPHIFDHGVWVDVYNDKCRTDFDGSPVICQGHEVSLLEWLGYQKLDCSDVYEFGR